MEKRVEKCYNIGEKDGTRRNSKGEKEMEDKKIVWERKATAEEVAKKIAEVMKEDLVGLTSVEGDRISFTLAGGQSFTIMVTER